MSERRDPVKWVETGQRVEAHYASDSGVHAVGKVIAYTDAPTVVIETDDGQRVSWRADMTQAVERTAETGAEYVFRSNLRGDGAAFLSLHRLGDDVHLRLRHVTSEPLAFEVAVLSPSERRALITALTEFDAESPARRSVRVENTPDGLSISDRQKVADLLVSGSSAGAARVLTETVGMSPENALAYIRDMPEYQTYLNHHGRTEVAPEEADRMRAMGFDRQPEFKVSDEDRASIQAVLDERANEYVYGGAHGWKLNSSALTGVVADIVWAAIRRDRERGDRG